MPFLKNMGLLFILNLDSLGDALLSQHELHSLKELLNEAERGIVFSVEDARKAEKSP